MRFCTFLLGWYRGNKPSRPYFGMRGFFYCQIVNSDKKSARAHLAAYGLEEEKWSIKRRC